MLSIQDLIPTLQKELASISVKLEAVQKARFALAEVYLEVERETD